MDGPSVPWITTSLLALTIVAVLLWALGKRPRSRLPFPPGPKPFPLIGNLLDMPREKEWQTYEQWYRKYGDIVHVSLLGKHIVILNSAKAVTDLLERRSAVYSSRPRAVMTSDLMGFGTWNLVVQEYGEPWRQSRRLFHSGAHQGIVPKYQSLQIRSARAFLKQLRENPNDLHTSVREHVGSTIIDVIYGIDNKEKDYLISVADEALRLFGQAVVPGSFMVDLIPALRYVPRWFPGASFHKHAERTRFLADEMCHAPLKEVKKAMLAGKARPSMVTQLLEEAAEGTSGASESDVADVMGVAYGAGADTTVSSILTFLLAMCNYPEVQAKAQAELLAVVGTDRLPVFSDRSNLPYINAIVLEVLRWQTVANTGVPHSTITDDEYDGYFIPKGTIVLGNIWSILHNAEEYPEPEEFRPERFLKRVRDGKYQLDDTVRNPRTVVFGFGRRVCPGRHLAEQSLFADIASIIAAFSVTPQTDKLGNPRPPIVKMSGGLVSHPLPFECSIKPRSARAAELIDQPLPERGL